jgi:hypothetical protein
VLAVLMLATSAYLFTSHPDGESLPAFYQWVLLVHIVGGLLILVPLVLFVVGHFRRMAATRNLRVMIPGILLTLTGLVLAVTGLTVMTQANSLAYRLVFRTHQVAALLVPVLFLAHRYLPQRRPPLRRAALGIGTVLLGAVLLAATSRVLSGPEPEGVAMQEVPPMGPAHSGGADPFVPFTPPALAGPGAIFAPSPVTTASGGPFPVSTGWRWTTCGRASLWGRPGRSGVGRATTRRCSSRGRCRRSLTRPGRKPKQDSPARLATASTRSTTWRGTAATGSTTTTSRRISSPKPPGRWAAS